MLGFTMSATSRQCACTQQTSICFCILGKFSRSKLLNGLGKVTCQVECCIALTCLQVSTAGNFGCQALLGAHRYASGQRLSVLRKPVIVVCTLHVAVHTAVQHSHAAIPTACHAPPLTHALRTLRVNRPPCLRTAVAIIIPSTCTSGVQDTSCARGVFP